MTNWLVYKRLAAWSEATCPRRSLTYFRRAFAAVWLTYDIIDICFHRTEIYLWSIGAPSFHDSLTICQGILIVSGIALLIGWQSRWFFLFAFAARLIEAWHYPINDYLYYCAVTLILTQCDTENLGKDPNPSTKLGLQWPRNLLIFQTAWIYLSSAFMKLNPSFLSGGDLYVRQNYLATALSWYYPAFYKSWISGLHGNAILAWMTIVVETILPMVLVAWIYLPQSRKLLRVVAVVLVFGIHGMGAFALNVYFFGASLFAQIFCLTLDV